MSAESRTDPKNFKPGLHQHYKGKLYIALFLGHHHEDRRLMVAYRSLEDGSYNFREWSTPGEDSWTDLVKVPTTRVGGITYEEVPRFKPLT